METMTSSEFAAAVHSAIAGVKHFYKEVGRLNAALTESLESDPDAFGRLLPAGKEVRDGRGVVVRDSHAQLFRPRADIDDEELDAVDEDIEEDSEEQEDGPRASKAGSRPVEIDPIQPLLLVKIALFDASGGETFQPHVQYAVLGDWGVGKDQVKKDAASFLVKRYMLKRVPRSVLPDTKTKNRVISTAKISLKGSKGLERRLSFRVLGEIRSKPLFELNGSNAVQELAQAIKSHWNQCVRDPAEVA